MSEVFRDSKLKNFDRIETWDTSNVTKTEVCFG
nr:hypothetical protein [Brachyspira hampsonii]